MHEENFVNEAGQIEVKAIEIDNETDYEMDQFFMLFDDDGVSGELITRKNSIAPADFAKKEADSGIKISGMGVVELIKKKSAELISRKNSIAAGEIKEENGCVKISRMEVAELLKKKSMVIVEELIKE